MSTPDQLYLSFSVHCGIIGIASTRNPSWIIMLQFDGKPTEAIHGLGVGIVAIAAHHVKVPEPHEKELQAILRRFNLNVDGLREKNRERLAELDAPANMAKLLYLSEVLINKARRGGLRQHKAALLVQVALCIEILLYAPMRRKTLVSLNLERNIHFIDKGRQRMALFEIPAKEVKNDRDLSFELSPDSTKLLDNYLRDWRPILVRQPSPYLFPSQNGSHKRKEHLAGLINW